MAAPQIATLSQRIAERRSNDNVTHLHPAQPVRLAAWVRRMQEGQLKAKVLYNGAFTPDGDGGAA